MSEWVAAVQGTLTVDSAAGRGTQVRGRIPLGTAISS
jgi:signal transduction histidine kinase